MIQLSNASNSVVIPGHCLLMAHSTIMGRNSTLVMSRQLRSSFLVYQRRYFGSEGIYHIHLHRGKCDIGIGIELQISIIIDYTSILKSIIGKDISSPLDLGEGYLKIHVVSTPPPQINIVCPSLLFAVRDEPFVIWFFISQTARSNLFQSWSFL